MYCLICRCVNWSRCTGQRRRSWDERRFREQLSICIYGRNKSKYQTVICHASIISETNKQANKQIEPRTYQQPQHKHSTISMQHSHVSSHRKQQHMAAILLGSVQSFFSFFASGIY